MARRKVAVEQEIAHMAGEFFARESQTDSLITVTHAVVSDNFKYATVFLSVLPQTAETSVLQVAKRQRSDFRDYIKKHSAFHPTPVVEFELDFGEKNRQRVDELTRKKV